MPVSVGLERIDSCALLRKGARFGLLANQASVDRDFHYAWDLLHRRFPRQLKALFSPQHGRWSEVQANMIESPHERRSELGVPVYSLYSETRRPTHGMLEGLDCLVIDLQDVGTRVYTFLWTVWHCLRACADEGLPVVVLDRPNPLGGLLVEGPILEPGFTSFVGEACVPMRHALTLGEMARLFVREGELPVELEVVRAEGWKRSMMWRDTGRGWIGPSPNVPRWESVAHYPGNVLMEGTNLSEGRGTTTPFEIIAAPFVRGDSLVMQLAEFPLVGCRPRVVRVVPTFDKWQGQRCEGVFWHITDADAYRPYATAIATLLAVRRLWPADFALLPPPYEYEYHRPPIDILSGSDELRNVLEHSRFSQVGLVEAWKRLTRVEADVWRDRTAKILLYS